jgi:hypothetical protein
MSTTTLTILIVVAAAAALAAFLYYQRRRSERLQGRFGPEYERTVSEFGDRRKAESELERRARRVERFNIRDLSGEERNRFADAWRADQTQFVDQPEQAVTDAHRLVTEVMRVRGYPVSGEFERNAADLSVDYPLVVEHYRAACHIAGQRDAGRANTEDLRKAMVHYRALFEELLGAPIRQRQEVRP